MIKFPKISVIVPSLNQGRYLEKTLESILLQKYPNLECVVIDGGSKDESIEIIRKHESCIAYWVSEPDNGQAHAINKGFARSTGEILSWLNSDDMFKPDILSWVAQQLPASRKPAWLIGSAEVRDKRYGKQSIQRPPLGLERHHLLNSIEHWIPQPSTFWNRAMWDKTGPLNETLRYVFDVQHFFSMLRFSPAISTQKTLSVIRQHYACKSIKENNQLVREWLDLISGYADLNELKAIKSKLFFLKVHRILGNIGISLRRNLQKIN